MSPLVVLALLWVCVTGLALCGLYLGYLVSARREREDWALIEEFEAMRDALS
jgi:hypothetical protein